MNVRTRFLIAALCLAATLTVRPAGTLAAAEKKASSARLTLSQPVFCDGSVRTRLEPGTYDVHVATAADGSVRATLSQGGVRKGETRAIGGTNEILIGVLLPAVQVPAVHASGLKAPAIQLPGAQKKAPTATPNRTPHAGQPGMGTQSSK